MMVDEVTDITDEIEAAFARLAPQLAPGAAAPSRAHLEGIVASNSTRLFVARGDDGTILGTLTLAFYPIPTNVRVWIEDVVVDAAARGQGVGEALVRNALEAAREMGARQVDLTSRPSREAANRLYLRLGFEQRDTNAYRFYLP
ncbi:MAG TPA: GNAT family N-acetyltransferase [Rhodothermales bacterium]|nr:GNAT family N-acetyltransferase [Rhodothermales bacterium]